MRVDRRFRDGLCRPGALCIVFNLLSHGGKPEFLIRQRWPHRPAGRVTPYL